MAREHVLHEREAQICCLGPHGLLCLAGSDAKQRGDIEHSWQCPRQKQNIKQIISVLLHSTLFLWLPDGRKEDLFFILFFKGQVCISVITFTLHWPELSTIVQPHCWAGLETVLCTVRNVLRGYLTLHSGVTLRDLGTIQVSQDRTKSAIFKASSLPAVLFLCFSAPPPMNPFNRR